MRAIVMTPRECVIAALARKPESAIPYQTDMTGMVERKLHEYYHRDDFAYSCLNNHLVREKNKKHTFHADGSYTDLFGVIWEGAGQGGDLGAPLSVLLPEPDLSGYAFPAPDAERIRIQCRRMQEDHPDRFRIYEISHTLFERAWMLRGMETLLTDFIIEPLFVDELFEKLTDYSLEIIDIVANTRCADCVMFGDDWGSQTGLIMSPAMWQRFIKPCLGRLLNKAKSYGFYTCLHSCGDISPLFGELIDMGLDIYNTFQPEIYCLGQFVKDYGTHLCVYGGISTQTTLPHGSPDDVRKAVEGLFHVFVGHGGLIAAPTHQITSDVPLENIFAFLDAVQQQEIKFR
jgi:uroporphyrinogen decarboxylase